MTNHFSPFDKDVDTRSGEHPGAGKARGIDLRMKPFWSEWFLHSDLHLQAQMSLSQDTMVTLVGHPAVPVSQNCSAWAKQIAGEIQALLCETATFMCTDNLSMFLNIFKIILSP